MATVALDANVIIGLLDSADEQHDRAVEVLRPRLINGDKIILGASVYAEVLIRPLQLGLAEKVDEFFDAVGANIIPVDRRLAKRAAGLRSKHRSLRLPDALSLATALEANADLLSLDHNLRRITMRERTKST